MKLYVGNLSFYMTEGDLRAAFEAHGDVVSAQIITEQETGLSRGLGLVEMADDQQAKAAIEALNGTGDLLVAEMSVPCEFPGNVNIPDYAGASTGESLFFDDRGVVRDGQGRPWVPYCGSWEAWRGTMIPDWEE